MEQLTDKLISLSNAHFIGSVRDAKDVVCDMLSPFADEIKSDKFGGIIAKIHGKTEHKILLQAHIDEIGFVVTKVLSGGFVRVSPVGGIDIRVLPSCKITIHGKRDIQGIFTSTPPHLNGKDNADKFPDFDEIMVDTGLDDANELICEGDFATFSTTAVKLNGGRVTGKSLDNRAGCLTLIKAAELIHRFGKPYSTVIFSFSAAEELGNRGARIASFDTDADEAIAVDVSFALSADTPPEHCGIMGKGAMIGISPVLDKSITDKLTDLSKSGGIPYQLEVMGGRTSTDADVISLTKSGIPCSLLSIPLKYMHTPTEVVSLSDIENTAKLICAYVTSKNGTEGENNA